MTATIEETSTESKTQKLDKDSFQFEGEFLDVNVGDENYNAVVDLLAEYRTEALALTAAKDRAFKVEEKIKTLMAGHETLRVNGEQRVTWKWEALTKFDKQRLAREYNEILNLLTERVPDGKRVFNAKGVVGVD